ncbi:hypothetical protein [Rhizobium sp. P44RR-XXIV]|uniref:hypothetical protein n=1 Tax=Rhizobium sp. P44RR-XXIV TaxID=1921145 RepID=UPI00145B6D91|nr:hypothetical protein [Rhizobium sp. P44RR-XXIV]
MRSNIISRLKTIFGFFPLDGKRDVSVQAAVPVSHDREPSARDYELYYWCSMPAPWY